MSTTQQIRRMSVGAAVILGLCLLGSRPAEAHHAYKCEGELEEDVILLDGIEDEGVPDCDAWGDWHVSVHLDDGEFNFHLHGNTDCLIDYKDEFEGQMPIWVDELLFYDCGIYVVEVEKTQVQIDHHGHVFLKVTGVAVLL